MLYVHAVAQGGPTHGVRGISIWVDTVDAAQARHQAMQALAAAGWELTDIDCIMATTAADYFRPCPSQQAFERARTDGIAWRFDDE